MESVLQWLQLYWGPLLIGGLTVGLFWLAATRKAPSKGGAASLLLTAAQLAKDLVKGAEQAWVTGKIEKDERYDIVMDQLAGLFPGLSDKELDAIVDAAVYGMNEFKRLPKPKAVTSG